MNYMNLLGQIMNGGNPMQMMLSMLNPQQRQMLNQFQGLSNNQQAEQIANYCNQRGITKDQLARLLNAFRR